ncbi:MAG: class I SAM-dependent methyltransferase [Sphingosinicella sp.]
MAHAPERPFDRRLRRLRRDRAASSSGLDPIHRHGADELFERLRLVKHSFAVALVLGCGDSRLGRQLREQGMPVVNADAGYRFAAAAGGVQCDEDLLPFADESFDLVVSAGGLDVVNDLPGALVLIRRVLKPGGLFLAALAGAGSLVRLKQSIRAAEQFEGLVPSPRIHPQIDVRAAGDLLARAGFAMPVADCETLTLRYAGFDSLIADLRAGGATNLLAERSRAWLGRGTLEAARTDFAAAAQADGKTAEKIGLIYLSGWRPERSG